MDKRIGFLGGGAMAEAIIRGLIDAKVVKPSNITVSDVNGSRITLLGSLGVNATLDNNIVVQASDVVVLAVKPDMARSVLEAQKDLIREKLLVSICAGVRVEALRAASGCTRIARVMPNQPCFVGEAASGIFLSSDQPESDQKIVESLFNACGKAKIVLKESLLDAVTGLSGSGPGYVFMFIEAMADGGVKAGLSRDVALQLAAQTVLGSAKMVLEMGLHPAELRNRVESPGGTTICGTSELEAKGLRSAVISAVTAAANRAEELGKK